MSRIILVSSLLLITVASVHISRPQVQLIPNGVGRSGAPIIAAASKPAAGPKDLTISVVQQPNPLLEVAKQLSKQFGVAISYEEPAWKAASDLMRFADTPRVLAQSPREVIARINPRLRAPALGSIEVHVTIPENADEFQLVGQILQDCLNDHGKRGNPGFFKLEKFGDYAYGIIPTSIRGDNEQWISTSSPLDARISFPAEERQLGATLAAIGKAVSEVTRQKFEIAAFALGPNSIYSDAISNTGAQNEVARDVLARTLREMSLGPLDSPKLWWNLGYAINGNLTLPNSEVINSPAYNLHFYIVTRTDADGRSQPMDWPRKPRGDR